MWALRKILLLLSSDKSPAQLSAGVAFAVLSGLVPIGTLLWWAILLLVLVLRVNLGMWTAVMGLVKLLAWPLGFALAGLGHAVLAAGFLAPFWTWLYAVPVVALSGWNRPTAMGGLVIGVVLFAPVFVLSQRGIHRYRERVLPHLEKYKVVRILKGSVLYKFYETVTGG